MLSKIINYIKENGWREFWALIDANYGFGKLELILSCNWFNPFATFWLNMRSFPFKQAFAFPIFVYGRPKLLCLSGRMKIEGKVSFGMIQFNKTLYGAPNNMSVKSEIFNRGTIIFRGKGHIGTGNKLLVAQHAVFDIGDYFKIADGINIGCFKYIKFGNTVRITHRSQILDSNYHYVANLTTRKINRTSAPIIIGNRCWICNSVTVYGGAVIPDNTIIASNSLVKKDFSNIPEYSMLGGVPAKYLSSGFARIYDPKLEGRISDYFDKNLNKDFYSISEDNPI